MAAELDAATLEARITRNEKRLVWMYRLMWMLPAAWLVLFVVDRYTYGLWEVLDLVRIVLTAALFIDLFYEQSLRIDTLECMAGLTALAVMGLERSSMPAPTPARFGKGWHGSLGN